MFCYMMNELEKRKKGHIFTAYYADTTLSHPVYPCKTIALDLSYL